VAPIYGLASTTVTILRGTATNAYGDVVDDPDNAQVVATGVLADIAVQSKRAYDPTSQTIRVIQSIKGSVQSDTDLVESDQLLDDRTGNTYTVQSVTQPGGPGFIGNLELELRRVT